MKRSCTCTRSSLAKEPAAKKCYVGYDTFLKRHTDLNQDYWTILWFDCETKTLRKAKGDEGQKTETKLKCKVCAKFRAKVATVTGGTLAIEGLRWLSPLGWATSEIMPTQTNTCMQCCFGKRSMQLQQLSHFTWYAPSISNEVGELSQGLF